jgi:hypothetical protein
MSIAAGRSAPSPFKPRPGDGAALHSSVPDLWSFWPLPRDLVGGQRSAADPRASDGGGDKVRVFSLRRSIGRLRRLLGLSSFYSKTQYSKRAGGARRPDAAA